MPPGLPQRALLLMGEYKRRVESLLPGFVLGYIFHDSLATGDFQPAPTTWLYHKARKGSLLCKRRQNGPEKRVTQLRYSRQYEQVRTQRNCKEHSGGLQWSREHVQARLCRSLMVQAYPVPICEASESEDLTLPEISTILI
jgi:hypothetical protein